MTHIPRKSDGRRIFTVEFKREQIGRVLRGELSLADLGRRWKIAPSLLQRWKRQAAEGPAHAGASKRYGTGVRTLRADQYIRELELLVGKLTVELELLRSEMNTLKTVRRSHGTGGLS
jgi:transposase-like protein